jgi:hypothetical protein
VSISREHRQAFGFAVTLGFLITLLTGLSKEKKTVIPPATDWTAVYEMSAKMDVAVNPERLFHGPAAVLAPNGDWLVCYQDSLDHSGRDGVISQVRSRDEGKTWVNDGIVYDGRGENWFGRNPAYGVTADGVIVLVVQRWRPLPPGDRAVTFRNEGIDGSVWLVSRDEGKTYHQRGLVDPEIPLRHQGSSSPLIRVGKTLMMSAVSLNFPPRGITLYESSDAARWDFAGWIFRVDQLPVAAVSYPSIVQRHDGSLLANCVTFSRNFQSISKDDGKTWSIAREVQDLRIRNNPDLDYAGAVLVAHGRGEDGNSVVLYFSPDDGLTWGSMIVLDRHGFRGWGGYSASLRTRAGDLFLVFSTDAGPRTARDGGRPDIRGLLLSDVSVRRKSGSI